MTATKRKRPAPATISALTKKRKTVAAASKTLRNADKKINRVTINESELDNNNNNNNTRLKKTASKAGKTTKKRKSLTRKSATS